MTRDRLIRLAALALTVALGTWIAFNTYWTEVTVQSPLQGEAARNPYYSIERFARALGARTRTESTLRVLPPAGSVLLLGDIRAVAQPGRFMALQHWVESGGRLAVTTGTVWSQPRLQNWTGISVHKIPPDQAWPRAAARLQLLQPTPRDGDCERLTEQRDGTATGRSLHVCIPSGQVGFASKQRPAWSLSNELGLQLLRVAIGRGSVIVVGSDVSLNPQNFLSNDDAEAFSEATQLRPGEELVILRESRAEPLLAMLWRLAAPALVCVALALVLLVVRNLPRFGPLLPVPPAARRSLADQIRANAALTRRTGRLDSLYRAALRAFDGAARAQLPGYGGLNSAARAAAVARRTGIDASQLRAALAPAPGMAGHQAAILILEQARRVLHDSIRRQPGIP